ncbi:MAG: chromate transporter [bacterium]|jgi:chromate transporter
MILWTLFISFFKIGAFSFGGGYAMLPLIQKEIIERHGYLTLEEFSDIIAIAEMTPGPIAINSATFVGYKTAGVAGSAVSTFGVVLPSFLVILLAAVFFTRFQKHPAVQNIFRGVRPVVIVLIVAAAVGIGKISLLDGASVVIAAAAFVAMLRTKLHPVAIIIAAGVAGTMFFA